MKIFLGVYGLVFLVVVHTLLAPAAIAGAIKYKVDSGTKSTLITGDAKTRRVGKLKLQGNSKVVITNNVVNILLSNTDLTAKEPAKEDPVLTGTAFCIKTKDSGTQTKITGYTFFDRGISISDLDVPGAEDSVTLADGTCYKGTITTVDGNELQITTETGTQSIRTSSIDSVSSPKVSKFEMTAKSDGTATDSGSFDGTCENITFKSTHSGTFKTSSEPKTSTRTPMTRKSKIIIGCVAVLIVATAIAVPLAVAIPLANRRSSPSTPFIAPAAPAMTATPEPTPAP